MRALIAAAALALASGTVQGGEDRARANADNQGRGRNRKGSFLRPADKPAVMNRHPRVMGSGAPSTSVAEQPSAHGRNYGRANHRGRAGGIASGAGSLGGASTDGNAGKSPPSQPKDHDSRAGK